LSLPSASSSLLPAGEPPEHSAKDKPQQQSEQSKRLSTGLTSKPRRRRESLDALLDSLSSWDLLYVRNRIRDGHVKMDGFASLKELPPEVFDSIVPHLRLQDVLNCYLVSRDWRETWRNGAVATALCRRFFPGLLELYGGDVPDRHELFVATAKCYLRKHFMSRTKRSFVPWDVGWSSDYFTNVQVPPPSRQLGDLRLVDFGFAPLTICYSNGKIAWQPDNCHIIVDDLYTRERARFSFGVDYITGRPLQLQAVTDSLVVLASSSQQTREARSTRILDNGQTMYVVERAPLRPLYDLADSRTVEPSSICSIGDPRTLSCRAIWHSATPTATWSPLSPSKDRW
jgi:hypothetical protein